MLPEHIFMTLNGRQNMAAHNGIVMIVTKGICRMILQIQYGKPQTEKTLRIHIIQQFVQRQLDCGVPDITPPCLLRKSRTSRTRGLVQQHRGAEIVGEDGRET